MSPTRIHMGDKACPSAPHTTHYPATHHTSCLCPRPRTSRQCHCLSLASWSARARSGLRLGSAMVGSTLSRPWLGLPYLGHGWVYLISLSSFASCCLHWASSLLSCILGLGLGLGSYVNMVRVRDRKLSYSRTSFIRFVLQGSNPRLFFDRAERRNC